MVKSSFNIKDNSSRIKNQNLFKRFNRLRDAAPASLIRFRVSGSRAAVPARTAARLTF